MTEGGGGGERGREGRGRASRVATGVGAEVGPRPQQSGGQSYRRLKVNVLAEPGEMLLSSAENVTLFFNHQRKGKERNKPIF